MSHLSNNGVPLTFKLSAKTVNYLDPSVTSLCCLGPHSVLGATPTVLQVSLTEDFSLVNSLGFFLYFYVYGCLACMCICAPCVFLVPVDVKL